MTKINTNEIRKRAKAGGVYDSAYLDMLTIADAYDEAQKDIDRLQMQLSMDEYRNGLLFKIGNRDLRISTLEALFRDFLKIEHHLIDEDGMCNICFCHMTKHDDSCYISRIQKELGKDEV